VLSLGLDQRWRRRVVRELGLDNRYDSKVGRKAKHAAWFGERPRVLDVATGTGDLAIEIARQRPHATVIGLDPSQNMLAIATGKLVRRELAGRVTLLRGEAEQLPFQACEMDAATIAFGIRNVPDRAAALREMARVVRPGGRVCILELSEPRGGIIGPLARFHVHVVVPRMGALLSGAKEYRYLQASIQAFPPADEFARLMERSGLDIVEVKPLTFGVCHLYVGTPRKGAQ